MSTEHFFGYKWTNISMSEMYWCLGILLKMLLICTDIDCFKLFLVPTNSCHNISFEIKDYPSWTLETMI